MSGSREQSVSREVEDSPDFERVLASALAANRLHESFRSLVVDMWRRRNEQWRVCCGSVCDPCIEAIGRAVDSLRKEFGSGSD